MSRRLPVTHVGGDDLQESPAGRRDQLEESAEATVHEHVVGFIEVR